MANIIAVDGTITHIDPKNGKTFTVEELQAAVGGYFEVMPDLTLSEVLFLADEEGSMKQLPLNKVASRLVGYDVVGPMMVMIKEEMGE